MFLFCFFSKLKKKKLSLRAIWKSKKAYNMKIQSLPNNPLILPRRIDNSYDNENC